MKRRVGYLLILALLAVLLSACGKEPIDPAYTASSLVISSFTEIAGENPDKLKETDGGYCYTYEVTDSAVGAAAYNLYKDYLDKNFTYSMTDSTAVGNGFCAVYYAENGAKIEYTEAVDEDGAYTISVTVPK